MKKALLAIAVIATTLTACSGETKTVYVPQTNSPVIQTTTTQAAPTIEEVYLTVVKGEYPQLNQMGDAYLLDLGYLICDSIDEGMTVYDYGLLVIDMGLDSYMMGYIGGAAIEAFCPWNDWFFQNL